MASLAVHCAMAMSGGVGPFTLQQKRSRESEEQEETTTWKLEPSSGLGKTPTVIRARRNKFADLRKLGFVDSGVTTDTVAKFGRAGMPSPKSPERKIASSHPGNSCGLAETAISPLNEERSKIQTLSPVPEQLPHSTAMTEVRRHLLSPLSLQQHQRRQPQPVSSRPEARPRAKGPCFDAAMFPYLCVTRRNPQKEGTMCFLSLLTTVTTCEGGTRYLFRTITVSTVIR